MNATITTKCIKCNGKGHIMTFQNIAGGICFDCKGAGSFTETVEKIQLRKARIATDKRRAQAQREANMDRMAPLHAVWEQRADLIADRYPEIHPEAMIVAASSEDLWQEDAQWMAFVDRRRN